jgi:hypothetical protein
MIKFAEDIDIMVELASADPSGAVTSGTLMLTSWLVPVVRSLTDPETGELIQRRQNVEFRLDLRQRVRNMILTMSHDYKANNWASEDGLVQSRLVFDDEKEEPESIYAVPMKQGNLEYFEGRD